MQLLQPEVQTTADFSRKIAFSLSSTTTSKRRGKADRRGKLLTSMKSLEKRQNVNEKIFNIVNNR